MWPPTPPAAYYHDPCSLFYAPRSITTATCPHSSHWSSTIAPHKMTWHLAMKMYIFPYPACVHRGTPLTRFDCHPRKKLSALSFTSHKRLVLLFIIHFFSSHTSHHSQTHFPISQTLSLSLSEIWENQKWRKWRCSLCCVCFQLWLSAADRWATHSTCKGACTVTPAVPVSKPLPPPTFPVLKWLSHLMF